jgi:osmotically-inducible protein OsmY
MSLRLPILLAACLALAGCKARDGDILMEAARRLGEKFEDCGASPCELTARFRAAAGGASLGARVENRIRWDRYLKDSDVEVTLTGTGVVTLRGQVPDGALKQRAVELARTTVGVERVVDELELPEEGD